MKILITGGAGFIGSNLVRWLLNNTQHSGVVFDALTYAGNLENLNGCLNPERFNFVRGSVTDKDCVSRLMADHQFEAVIHLAAETHVDRSIFSADQFVATNVMGTLIMLECSRVNGVKRFVHVSTDEVYGDLGESDFPFTENHPLRPSSPYAASKAGSDHIVQSFIRTFNMDCVITRCSNNYGPYQFPEKFIPLMIVNAMEERTLPIYGDGKQRRDWLYVSDHCRGLALALEKGIPGEVYNFGSGRETSNIGIVQRIVAETSASAGLIKHVADRPGHDRRYALNNNKARIHLGWEPQVGLEDGLHTTVSWFSANTDWCNNVRTGEYRMFYERQYNEQF